MLLLSRRADLVGISFAAGLAFRLFLGRLLLLRDSLPAVGFAVIVATGKKPVHWFLN